MKNSNKKLATSLLCATALFSTTASLSAATSNHGAGAINPATGKYYEKQVGQTPAPASFKGQDAAPTNPTATTNHGAGAINPATGKFYEKQVGQTPAPAYFKGQDAAPTNTTTASSVALDSSSSAVRGVTKTNNNIMIAGVALALSFVIGLFTFSKSSKNK